MKTIVDKEDFGIVVGIDWRRWFFGISIEEPKSHLRVAVLRFGPAFMHIISQR